VDPTPGEFAGGWHIEVSEASLEALSDLGCTECEPDCNNTAAALAWVASLPSCAPRHNHCCCDAYVAIAQGPLTDEKIHERYKAMRTNETRYVDIYRDAEAAHGITGETK
jgi:hypothetical protein